MSARLDLLKDAVAVAVENYKDNVRIFAGLDDKAQKMGAIAGIFLGALLAIIKPDAVSTLQSAIGPRGLWTLTSVILLLMACIVLCLLCMWVGRIPPPLSLGHMVRLTADLLRLQEAGFNDSIQEGYNGEKLAIWTKCIQAQEKVATRKMRLVFAAQLVLAIAILLIAFMLLHLIHSVHVMDVPVVVQFD